MDLEEKGHEVSPSDGRDWSAQVEQLLENWHKRVYAAQAAHYASADVFRLLNYVVGIPAVVFSSIVGTAVFVGLEHDSPRTLVVAGASILAAVLAGLQTLPPLPRARGAYMAPPPTGTRRSGATLSKSSTFRSSPGARPRTASTGSTRR